MSFSRARTRIDNAGIVSWHCQAAGNIQRALARARWTLRRGEQGTGMSIESLKTEPVQRSALSAAGESRGVNMAFLAALAASFFVAYLPTYLRLAATAWRTEQEGHGPLIMLAAAWLAWQQRDKLRAIELRPAPVAGWIILLLSLLLMAVTRSQDMLMIEVATQIPVLLGCLLLIGGWPLARIFAFPLAFLVFSMPPPGWLLDAFTVPLKAWISDIVSNSLYDLGYPVAQNGVMIMIGSYELMVKDACSGMNSIFALSAIGVFYVYEFVSQQPDSQGHLDPVDRSDHDPGQLLPRRHACSGSVLYRHR